MIVTWQLSSLLALIAPAAGGGGLVILVLFFVGPVSLIIHVNSGRFVRTWLGVSGAFTFCLLLLAVICDLNAPQRLQSSLRFVFVGGMLSLVMTFFTGLLVLIVRLLTAREDRSGNP